MKYKVKILNPPLGVPITFLDKYNPEQFEILGIDRELTKKETGRVSRFYINGAEKYARIVIRHLHPEKPPEF